MVVLVVVVVVVVVVEVEVDGLLVVVVVVDVVGELDVEVVEDVPIVEVEGPEVRRIYPPAATAITITTTIITAAAVEMLNIDLCDLIKSYRFKL